MESLPGYEYKVLPPVDLVVHEEEDQKEEGDGVEGGIADQRPGSQGQGLTIILIFSKQICFFATKKY